MDCDGQFRACLKQDREDVFCRIQRVPPANRNATNSRREVAAIVMIIAGQKHSTVSTLFRCPVHASSSQACRTRTQMLTCTDVKC